MAIVAISDLSYGERSVSFSTFTALPFDTLDFSVIVAALATAGVQSSAIKTFLSTTHVDAANTVKAFAQNGVILSYVNTAPDSIAVIGNNQMTVGTGTSAVRISLAASISA